LKFLFAPPFNRLNRNLEIYMLTLSRILLLCVPALVAGAASAQPYPSKPIRIIVPVVAGGSPDIFARVIGLRLTAQMGQPVIVENRAGAGQMIGAELVAKSAADGYTIMVTTGSYATSAAIRTNLPFDPLNDFTGISKVGIGPLLVVVHPSLPVQSFKELIAFARARPGQLNYGSAGSGTTVHFAAEVLAASAKIDLVHVPYKSGVPMAVAALAGEVPMMLSGLTLTWPHIKANRLRALAVTTAQRSAFVPDLPTVAEAGVPGYDASLWWGAFAPARTPADVVVRLNGEINKILATDDMKSRVASEGADVVLMSADAFTAFWKGELAKWTKVAKERNIKAN